MIRTIRDGTRIEIRQLRPEDRDNLEAAVRNMSPASRYRRFLSATDKLSKAELDYLTQVDHRDHEALVAQLPDTQEGLGLARFVRLAEDPEVAELAIAVADAWQRRGIGTVLLNELTRRAREVGIRRFSALTLSDNHTVIDMLERLGPVRVHGYEAGAVQLEVELPDLGLTPALKETLRAAGRGELHVRGRG